MWFGILYAIILDIAPGAVSASVIGFFVFVMNNIGGNLPVIIQPLRVAFGYRTALTILYPGLYFLSKYMSLR